MESGDRLLRLIVLRRAAAWAALTLGGGARLVGPP